MGLPISDGGDDGGVEFGTCRSMCECGNMGSSDFEDTTAPLTILRAVQGRGWKYWRIVCLVVVLVSSEEAWPEFVHRKSCEGGLVSACVFRSG